MGETTEQWRAAIGRWSGGRPGKCVIMESFAGRKRDNDSFRWFSCFLLASLLVIGCVELNPGPNGVEVTPATTYQDGALSKYIKRPGTVSIEGELYGIRVASFLFARGLNKTEEFHLASNVDFAGAFDDVVFKYRLKGQDICKTCFIQLKHRKTKKIQKPILRSSLLQLSGDFSLFKYFESYCEIKRNFSEDSNLKMYGSFVDFEFIIYTNARLKGGIEVGNDKNLVSILSSEPNDGTYVTFDEKSGEDVFDFFKELSNYYIFLVQMAAYTDEEIKQEIENLNNNFTNDDIKKRLEKLKSEPRNIALKKLIKELEKCDFSLYEEFLQKVKIFQCQANESSFVELIKKELQEVCYTSPSGTNSIYENLKQVLENWWKEVDEVDILSESSSVWQSIKQRWIEKIKELSKIDVQGSIEYGISFTEPHIQPLSEALQRSKLLNVITKNNCGTLSKLKIYQALNSLGQENSLFISLKSLLDRREEILKLWPCKWSSLLVIDCEEGPDNDEKYLADILTDILHLPQKKCVVISQHKHPHLASQLQQKLENVYAEYKDDCSLFDLDNKSQEIVLEKTVDFQGTEVPLEALIGKDPLEDIKQSINSQALSLLLGRKQKICIGRKLSDPPSCYVSRILEHHVYLNDDILKSANATNVFAITGLEPSQLEHYLPVGEKIYKFKFDKISGKCCFKIADPSNKPIGHHNGSQSVNPEEVRYVILGNEHPESNLKKLKIFCKNVHWVHREDSYFVWRDSSCDIDVIRNYIDKTKYESYDVKSLMEHNGSIMLLAAEAGMGKSMFLSHMEHEIKKWNSSMWVLRLNLNDHTSRLESTKFEEECIDKCKEFLWEAGRSKEQNALELEKKIFLHALEQRGKVVLMLDGFDEICPHYSGKVEKLITEIRNKTASKFWISSRSTYQKNLEKTLMKIAFTLRPFTRKKQIIFLKQFWNKTNGKLNQGSLRNFAKKLLRATSKNFSDKDGNFTVIPLHTMMLSEAFVKEVEDYCLSGKDNLPENFNLLDLYRKFTENKCDIYLGEKITMDLSKPKANEDRKKYVKKHMIPALMSLFSRDELNLLLDTEVTNYLQKATKFLQSREADQCGMITDFTDSRPRFIHRCFAEYFSAKWFTENFSKCGNFISDSLFFHRYEIIQNIFDRMLAEEYRLHDAVLNNDPESVNKLLLEKTDVNSLDKGGRTALHLAASYNSKITKTLLSVTGVDTNISDGVLKWTPLRYAAKTRSWMAVDSLLEGGADDIVLKEFYHDKEWRRAAQRECATKGHICFLEFIMNSGFDVNAVDSIPEYNFYNVPLLHVASMYRKVEVVRLLIERGADINVGRSSHGTALHFAAQVDDTDIMTLLVDKGMSVNETSTGGETPLHKAAFGGNLIATVFLVGKGAHLEVADANGRTPLMVAASRGKLEVVRYLAENGADVNACSNFKNALLLATERAHVGVMGFLLEQGADINGSNVGRGTSPLRFAVENNDLQTVKFLIERGADINFSFKNETALHFAPQADKVDLMTLLVDAGMSVNETGTGGETPLHKAARYGNLRATELLVERGAHLEVANANGRTPLMVAASRGKLEIVRYFTMNGADVNACNNGVTALLLATEGGRWDVMDFLLEQGADINGSNVELGTSPLQLAIADYDLKTVKFLIKRGADVNFCSSEGSEPPPLHLAVICDYLDVMNCLIEAGANLNPRDANGSTPLHYALSRNYTELALHLVEKGADVNIPNSGGRSPLQLSVIKDNVKCAKLFVKFNANVNYQGPTKLTALSMAIRLGRMDIVNVLVENGADINLRDDRGQTALHAAVWKGESGLVQYLIARGADVNIPDSAGKSPLQLSVIKDNVKFAKLFVNFNANVNYQGPKKLTALSLAIRLGRMDIVNVLVENGAYINLRDDRGQTALHAAVGKGESGLVQYLIVQGADVNIPDSAGRSPLQLSVIKDNVQFAKLFVNFNANVNYQGPKKLTALSMAIRLGRMNIVNVLVKNGADINLRDDRGQTALHAAVMRGYTGLVDYLIARGADVNIPNIRLETPVDWIYSRQWEIPADYLERHERNSIPDVPLLVDLFATETF